MEDPAGVWFSDRIDGAKAGRDRLRWYAVGFNGLFLSLFDFGPIGTILFAVASFVLGREYMGRRERMRPLTSALDSPAAIPHEPVRMEIYRDGVLLGADEGWLGRRNGALAYEGRRTRFEIVITDLDVIPRYAATWEPTRLQVNGERGVVEVEFRPWHAEDASRARIQSLLMNWPWAIRRLAGPPSLPDSRRPYPFLLSKAFDKMVIPVVVAGLGLAAFTTLRKDYEPLAYTAFMASLAFIGAWIFQRVYRRDQKDVARLEAADRESPLARTSAPTEPSPRENVETVIR